MTKKILTCLLLCLMTAGCKHDNTIKGGVWERNTNLPIRLFSTTQHEELFIPKRGTYGLLTALWFTMYAFLSKRITTSAKANM